MKKPKNIGGKFHHRTSRTNLMRQAKQDKKSQIVKTMKFLPFPCVTIFSPRWSTKPIALPLKY